MLHPTQDMTRTAKPHSTHNQTTDQAGTNQVQPTYLYLVVRTLCCRRGQGADGSQRTWIESCNARCSCSADDVGLQLEPVCISDGRRYYSPCHAGCSQLLQTTAGRIVSCTGPLSLLPLGGQKLRGILEAAGQMPIVWLIDWAVVCLLAAAWV